MCTLIREIKFHKLLYYYVYQVQITGVQLVSSGNHTITNSLGHNLINLNFIVESSIALTCMHIVVAMATGMHKVLVFTALINHLITIAFIFYVSVRLLKLAKVVLLVMNIRRSAICVALERETYVVEQLYPSLRWVVLLSRV